MEKNGEGEGEGRRDHYREGGEGEGEGQGRRDHRESEEKPITRFDLRPVVKEKEKEKAEKEEATSPWADMKWLPGLEGSERQAALEHNAQSAARTTQKGGGGEEEEELVNETVVTITVTPVNRGTGFEPQTNINATTNTKKFKRPRTAPEQEGYEVEFKRPRPAP